jgi:ABC-type sugar transport system substrate-binding protein
MKMKKKLLVLVLAIAMVMVPFVGCATPGVEDTATDDTATDDTATDDTAVDDTATDDTQDGEKVYQVACLFRIQDMYASWLKTAYEEVAEQYDNINLTVFDNQDDAVKFKEIMEDCITQKFDYIVAQTNQADMTDVITQARDAGIKYININLELPYMAPLGTTIVCDEYLLGKAIAERAAEELPENAKVCILNGIAGIPPTTERRRGMQEGLLDARPDIELLDEQTADFDKMQAMAKTDDWLQLFPQIDAILASSDSMVLGAIESFRSNGRDLSQTKFYGIDGLTDACKSIIDGEMSASALQDATVFASMSLDLIMDDINGETDLMNDFDELVTFAPTIIDETNAEEQLAVYEEAGLVK